METCPKCAADARSARVVCATCGETLPLRVVVVSTGSRGGGFALVEEIAPTGEADVDVVRKQEQDKEASI